MDNFNKAIIHGKKLSNKQKTLFRAVCKGMKMQYGGEFQQGGKLGCPPGYYFDFDQQNCVKGDYSTDVYFTGKDGRSDYDGIDNTINLANNPNSFTINHEMAHAEQSRNGLLSPDRGVPLNTGVLALNKEYNSNYYNKERNERRGMDIENVVQNLKKSLEQSDRHYTPDLIFAGKNAAKNFVEKDVMYSVPGTAEYDANEQAYKDLQAQNPIRNVKFNFRKRGGKMQLGGTSQTYQISKNGTPNFGFNLKPEKPIQDNFTNKPIINELELERQLAKIQNNAQIKQGYTNTPQQNTLTLQRNKEYAQSQGNTTDSQGNIVISPLNKLASNPTFNKFADNIAFPIMDASLIVEGAGLARKGLIAILRGAPKATQEILSTSSGMDALPKGYNKHLIRQTDYISPSNNLQMFTKDDPKFKSEINWGNWNKEIPNNDHFIQEYSQIEDVAKQNGTWMKNPDGSTFNDTPEQFVQQNSERFKMAFPKGFNNVYRGVGNNTPELHPNKSIFTGNKSLAKNYGNNGNYFIKPDDPITQNGLYDLAHRQSSNSLTFDGMDRDWANLDLKSPSVIKENLERNISFLDNQLKNHRDLLSSSTQNSDGSWSFPNNDLIYSNYLYKQGSTSIEEHLNSFKDRLKNINNLVDNPQELEKMRRVLGDKVVTNEIGKYIQDKNLDFVKIKNIDDGVFGDVSIVNHSSGNYLKSLRYNNGMFDMTNPNIYKAIIPAVIAGTAAYQSKQMGGNINTTGYLDGASTANNPYNIIPGGNITMQGVNQPIMATAIKNGKIGKRRLMQPGKDYNFDADYVYETKMQQGGQPRLVDKVPEGYIPMDKPNYYHHPTFSDMALTQTSGPQMSNEAWSEFIAKNPNWNKKQTDDIVYTQPSTSIQSNSYMQRGENMFGADNHTRGLMYYDMPQSVNGIQQDGSAHFAYYKPNTSEIDSTRTYNVPREAWNKIAVTNHFKDEAALNPYRSYGNGGFTREDVYKFLFDDNEDSPITTPNQQEIVQTQHKLEETNDQQPDENEQLALQMAMGNGVEDGQGYGNSLTQGYGNPFSVNTTNSGFKKFNSPEEGRQALLHQLDLYQTGKTRTGLNGNSTLLQAMSKYAPYSDGNNPLHYASVVAKETGVSIHTPISQIDKNKWANAITKMEGNKKGNNPGNLRK